MKALAAPAGDNLAQVHSLWIVHCEYGDRGATFCREADKLMPTRLEMVGPNIAPRIEQFDYATGIGIDSSEIWAYMKVAELACQRQVIKFAQATVLDRDDMLDMKRIDVLILVEPAVFTNESSTDCHSSTRRSIHLRIR